MSERIIALILSFLCCGLGQIYNRQILKGIDLIIIYLGSVILAIFSSRFSISNINRSLILAVASFLWIIGMIDAYIDGDWFFLRRKWVFIYIAISVLPAIFITAFSFWKYFYLASNNITNDSGKALISKIPGTIVEDNNHTKLNNAYVRPKVNKISEPSKIYIQVATLKDPENVANLRRRLEKKGYKVVVEPVKIQNEFFHRVIVDDIKNEKSADNIADEIRREENTNVIIRYR